MRLNTVLIPQDRDTRLKTKQQRIGVRSKTDIAIMYMEDLVQGQHFGGYFETAGIL